MKKTIALILAAGKGTRMKSKLPKVLHRVGGIPMVEQVLKTVKAAGTDRQIVVIGFGSEQVRTYLGDAAEFVVQLEQLGTGHAVQQAKSLLAGVKGTVLVTCGDTPLVQAKTFTALLKHHNEAKAGATILTATASDPQGYGRIIRTATGQVCKIVEQKDGLPEELTVKEINTGIYCFDNELLWRALEQLSTNNAQGEYYLTDVIEIMVAAGEIVAAYMTDDAEQTLGVNSRVQLAEAESVLRKRKMLELMEAGVTIIDPQQTYVDASVTVGMDTILYPGTILEGTTKIGSDCKIGPYTQLTNVIVGTGNHIQFTYGHDCIIKNDTQVGPYVHFRPDTIIGDKVKVGNFVEVKNSIVGTGTKFPHLSYIGDSDVGAGVNIGCGTITVNYDGKEKHRTTISDGAFIGCNSNLIAPVTIGEDAFIGAGSTITKNVPSKALGVCRARQINMENWVKEDTYKK